jgi:hypothetical protein
MDDNRYIASLRISSKTLTAADITTTLGIEPTRQHEKGTPFSSRNPRSRLREASSWLLESDLSRSEPLEAHLEKLATLIEEKISQLKYLMTACQIDIFCGLFSESGQAGCVLNSLVIKRLAVLPIDIVFDCYVSSPEEEDNSSPEAG